MAGLETGTKNIYVSASPGPDDNDNDDDNDGDDDDDRDKTKFGMESSKQSSCNLSSSDQPEGTLSGLKSIYRTRDIPVNLRQRAENMGGVESISMLEQ